MCFSLNLVFLGGFDLSSSWIRSVCKSCQGSQQDISCLMHT